VNVCVEQGGASVSGHRPWREIKHKADQPNSSRMARHEDPEVAGTRRIFRALTTPALLADFLTWLWIGRKQKKASR
jgi:hypothetical protein